LVLAQCWPEQRIVLLDAMHRRCEFLVRAADTLGPRDPGHGVEVGRSSSRAKRNTARRTVSSLLEPSGRRRHGGVRVGFFDPTGASW